MNKLTFPQGGQRLLIKVVIAEHNVRRYHLFESNSYPKIMLLQIDIKGRTGKLKMKHQWKKVCYYDRKFEIIFPAGD